MAIYQVTQVLERRRTWFVEANSVAHAEDLASRVEAGDPIEEGSRQLRTEVTDVTDAATAAFDRFRRRESGSTAYDPDEPF
jgi:hypothetical protein